MPTPPPTARLLRAVAAERDELDRHHARMSEEADELRRALTRIERGLAEIAERRALLDQLSPPGADASGKATPRRRARVGAGSRQDATASGYADQDATASGHAGARPRRAATASDHAGAGPRQDPTASGHADQDATASGHAGARSDGGDEDGMLRGPEIRAAAVRVLLERGGEAMHYRDWYALVEERGLVVAGKDPLAVFLTQLGRSPAVRRGVEAGVYELDRHAAAQHRTKLETLQRELRELTLAAGGDLGAIRARRQQLSVEIGRVERSLEEIARVLGPTPPLAAAG